jgi:hypothetical protein
MEAAEGFEGRSDLPSHYGEKRLKRFKMEGDG